MLIKKLSKHGNSLALVMDKAVLELLNIDEQTPLNISTDGRALVIAPAKQTQRRKRFNDALKNCNARYGKTLRKLAE